MPKLFEEARSLVVMYEGLHTYGGLAGRDMEAMERGIVSAGRDPETGERHYPKLELVRLAIPRRVYTQAYMDVVAESVVEVYRQRREARRLRMTLEPKFLRFFQPRFEPLG